MISFLILHLCIVCVDSANVFKCPACERGGEREACEIERVCERKCPTARVCGKA